MLQYIVADYMVRISRALNTADYFRRMGEPDDMRVWLNAAHVAQDELVAFEKANNLFVHEFLDAAEAMCPGS